MLPAITPIREYIFCLFFFCREKYASVGEIERVCSNMLSIKRTKLKRKSTGFQKLTFVEI